MKMNEYTWDDIYEGQEECFSVDIREEDLAMFKQLTGDENPLHTDNEYARTKGFPERVTYGMLAASYLSTLAGMFLPGKHSLIHHVEVDFHKPVYRGGVFDQRCCQGEAG